MNLPNSIMQSDMDFCYLLDVCINFRDQ